MKKYRIVRILFTAILLLSLLILPSCRQIVPYLQDYIAINSGITPNTAFSLYENLEIDFDQQIANQIEERFEKLEEMLASNNVLRTIPFVALFARQNSELYYVGDAAQMCYLKFSMDPEKNASYMDEYTRISALYTDYSSRLIRMYRPVYESVYCDTVFGNWSEEEIEMALKLSDSYTDEVVSLTKQRDELLAAYYKLDQKANGFLSDSEKCYKQIVTLNNRIAEKLGYDGYVDYAYDHVYSRDYTKDDAKRLYEYVRSYIVPLAEDLQDEIAVFATTDRFQKEYLTVYKYDFTSSELDSLLESYYGYFYDNPEVFVKQWRDLTVFGTESSYSAAFTLALSYYGLPVCYYGGDYQDPFTIIHEQGHFAAILQMPGGYNSIDLCEVHSQGNEWLFLSYLKDQSSKKDRYDEIAKVMLYEQCLSIIIATACDMFEQTMYDDLPSSNLDAAFKDCLNYLGAYELLNLNMNVKPEYYWHYAIVSNSMYYLSYAVSMIPAVELYVVAQSEGFEIAASRYSALMGYNSYVGFSEALGEAGLSSPFESTVYVQIKEYFS